MPTRPTETSTLPPFDLPDTTRSGDLHLTGNRRLAWLKDPDGNILAIANQ